jgi:hypothetical protein
MNIDTLASTDPHVLTTVSNCRPACFVVEKLSEANRTNKLSDALLKVYGHQLISMYSRDRNSFYMVAELLQFDTPDGLTELITCLRKGKCVGYSYSLRLNKLLHIEVYKEHNLYDLIKLYCWFNFVAQKPKRFYDNDLQYLNILHDTGSVVFHLVSFILDVESAAYHPDVKHTLVTPEEFEYTPAHV